MSPIGGPGGVGGPKGPSGPEGTSGPDELSEAQAAGRPEAARPGDFERVAADIAAGRITPQQAIEQMVDQLAGTQALDPAHRAELRAMLVDLVANDPYLAGLLGRL
jgi:hypothetical protein